MPKRRKPLGMDQLKANKPYGSEEGSLKGEMPFKPVVDFGKLLNAASIKSPKVDIDASKAMEIFKQAQFAKYIKQFFNK